MLQTLVARMSSELAGLTNEHYNKIKSFTEIGRQIEEEFILEDEEDDTEKN